MTMAQAKKLAKRVHKMGYRVTKIEESTQGVALCVAPGPHRLTCSTSYRKLKQIRKPQHA